MWNSIHHAWQQHVNMTPHYKRKIKTKIQLKFKRSFLLFVSLLFRVISGTSNVCHVSTDCPMNAYCEPRSGWDGQCVCRDGYYMQASGKTRACIQIADYGELCYLDQQCEFRLGLQAECRNGQCSCRVGSHYIVSENACFKSSSKLRVKNFPLNTFEIAKFVLKQKSVNTAV